MNRRWSSHYWEQVYEARKSDPRFNTSYPLAPSDWGKYQEGRDLEFSSDEISFYIHIPFCEHLCTFCEYVKYKTNAHTRDIEKQYLNILRRDTESFLAAQPPFVLRGFDIGGGTPTALSDANFAYLMQIYSDIVSRCRLAPDYVPSIEATFATINETKVRGIAQAGFQRISLGLQVSHDELLKAHHRALTTLSRMSEVMEMCHAAGIALINIDLMYGFENQTNDICLKTLEAIDQLRPEHVSFYELRTNMLHDFSLASKEEIYQQYQTLYEGVKSMGYIGDFGQNTFSRYHDMGLSSYLYSRMIDHVSYKGFGIAAQSRSDRGLSYNRGKRRRVLAELLKYESFCAEDSYQLPVEEVLAKYVAISGYCGFFRLSIMQSIIGLDPRIVFQAQFEFLESAQLVTISGDEVRITPEGFKYYGAILSLFYP